MLTSPVTQAQHCPNYRKRKNRIASQIVRDQARERLNKDIQTYELFNSICKCYGPQKWVPSEFKDGDIPADSAADRKERNRIASRNSRVRKRAMEAELQSRLSVLQDSLQPSFEPPLDFAFPFNEEDASSIEVKIGGRIFQSGTWVQGEFGWVHK